MLRFFTSEKRSNSTTIKDEQSMWFILERERARAERSKTPFALIVMTFELGMDDGPETQRIAAILEQRLRLTDEAGMLNDRQLAIILSDTSEGGAWKVVRDVTAKMPAERQAECEVYIYPSMPDGLPDGDERNSRLGGRYFRPAPDASSFYVQPLPTWKRVIDLVLGSATLFCALPILALAAVAIKATSKGPVIFKQRRAGLGGAPFTIYKLRTMVADAENQQSSLRSVSEQDGPAFKLRNDPRVTAVGRFLRKSCIDELPQLWNVLKGEMSIVGPRPLPIGESESCDQWEKRRLDVTPGLTCIWQVRGALKVSFSDWMRMDIRYIRARTMATDFKLMVQTAMAVLFHRASV